MVTDRLKVTERAAAKPAAGRHRGGDPFLVGGTGLPSPHVGGRSENVQLLRVGEAPAKYLLCKVRPGKGGGMGQSTVTSQRADNPDRGAAAESKGLTTRFHEDNCSFRAWGFSETLDLSALRPSLLLVERVQCTAEFLGAVGDVVPDVARLVFHPVGGLAGAFREGSSLAVTELATRPSGRRSPGAG